jgi:hypothetical protein
MYFTEILNSKVLSITCNYFWRMILFGVFQMMSLSSIYTFKIFSSWAGEVAQVVEHLPNKHEALSSTPPTPKNVLSLFILE